MKREWNVPWRWIAALLGGAVLLGGLVAASGIVSIKASSRHWAVTRWVLEFSMRRSVSTHSFGIEAPELQTPGLALKGAGAYAINCAPCHGSPGSPYPRVAYQMTPFPPDLTQTAGHWSDEHLFTIIKHGIKFTGMPAWPAQHRDDEVWAMVAFVRQLPTLSAAEYDRLAYGKGIREEEAGKAPEEGLIVNAPPASPALESCIRCHGADGNGRGQPEFPKLAGQRFEYLLMALEAYAQGRRASGIMEPIAHGLDQETRDQLARYFAELPAQAEPTRGDATARERGRQVALQGDRRKRVPSCVDCHGPAGHERRPEYPLLAGQRDDYLVRQLKLFQSEHRGGGEFAHLMHHVAPRLNEQQIQDVAAYFSSLPPDQPAP